VLRKALAAQPDGSVVLVSIGFLTNIARLLESGPDAVSPLSGADLVRRKVRMYSLMAGDFSSERRPEYNAIGDGAATRTVLSKWPTPMVLSGFEIGLLVPFPAESIEQDFAYAERHPVAEAYRAYQKMPYDRPSWDLTCVLYAVFPDRGYFGLSPKGKIALDDAGRMVFTPGSGGNCRYLTLTREQAVRVREAFVWLATSPPK